MLLPRLAWVLALGAVLLAGCGSSRQPARAQIEPTATATPAPWSPPIALGHPSTQGFSSYYDLTRNGDALRVTSFDGGFGGPPAAISVDRISGLRRLSHVALAGLILDTEGPAGGGGVDLLAHRGHGARTTLELLHASPAGRVATRWAVISGPVRSTALVGRSAVWIGGDKHIHLARDGRAPLTGDRIVDRDAYLEDLVVERDARGRMLVVTTEGLTGSAGRLVITLISPRGQVLSRQRFGRIDGLISTAGTAAGRVAIAVEDIGQNVYDHECDSEGDRQVWVLLRGAGEARFGAPRRLARLPYNCESEGARLLSGPGDRFRVVFDSAHDSGQPPSQIRASTAAPRSGFGPVTTLAADYLLRAGATVTQDGGLVVGAQRAVSIDAPAAPRGYRANPFAAPTPPPPPPIVTLRSHGDGPLGEEHALESRPASFDLVQRAGTDIAVIWTSDRSYVSFTPR